MDSINEIAMSKIADILSNGNLIVPEVDIWKKIFNNAGLSDDYEEIDERVVIKIENYGYYENQRNYYHNDKCYEALYETFLNLEDEQEEFLKLLNNIIFKIPIRKIFTDNIESIMKKEKYKLRDEYIEDYINNTDVPPDEKTMILNRYPSKDFKLFRSNLNMLNLDVAFDEDGILYIKHFTSNTILNDSNDNILSSWLNKEYPKVAKSYIDAVKAYGKSDFVGCISHCRNIITGIFSFKKDTERKWMDGLHKACCKDRNISNLTPAKVVECKYNANSSDVNCRYQYPRFNLIYKLYSFTSALGPHINEGNKVGTNVDTEDVLTEDAFMALRMTEDVLLWVYQSDTIKK